MNNLKNKLAALVALSLAVALPASAAVPTEASTAFTDLGTDFATYLGLMVTLTIAVKVGFISVKWIKRVLGAST